MAYEGYCYGDVDHDKYPKPSASKPRRSQSPEHDSTQWPGVPWCHHVWPAFVNPINHGSYFGSYFYVVLLRHSQ